MSCLFPVGVYKDAPYGQKKGKLSLRPCGMCKKCRLETAKGWSVRIMHESRMHEKNCFLSLTYNDENLPKDGSVRKSDVQWFIKRLRKHCDPLRIRFYACAEYGPKRFRPHYHVIIFGYDFDDKEIWKCVNKGQGGQYFIYISETLSKIWNKGFSTSADLTMESALYTARYVRKKITGNSDHAKAIKEKRYNGKSLEFALMSRMPGIGKPWFDEFGHDVFPKDFVTINGCKFKPPRYYDNLYARENPFDFALIKEKREEKIQLAFPDEWESLNKNRFYEQLTKNIDKELDL